MSRMNALLGRSAVAMMLVGGPSLLAQSSTGALSGVIKDSKGAPLAGAQVTLNSPALFQPKVIITDANGEYRAPLLPVGDYTVRAEKAGFLGATSPSVRVGLGSGLRQDLTLKTAEEQSVTVVIVANAATVDKTDTKDSVNVSAQTLQDLPGTDRNFGGAADLSPGVVTDAGGTASIRGGTSLSTLYNINGANVKDDYEGGLTGNYLIEDNVEDVQVILSPLNARYGRTVSGQINVTTKTGGNDFEGSIRAQFDRNSWDANNGATGPLDRELSDNQNRQYQVTLRGPVWKDHIWFSVGTILTPPSTNTYTLASFGASSIYKDPYETGNGAIDAAANAAPAGYKFAFFQSGQPYVSSTDAKYWEGKLTWGITPNHTVSLAYSKSKDTISNRDPYGDVGGPIISAAALGVQTDEQTTTTLNYTGTLTSSMFLEAKYSDVTNHAVFPTGDPEHPEPILMRIHDINSAAAYPFGLTISPRPDKRDNKNATVNLKLFRDWAGQMEFDFGGEYYEADRGTSLQTGPNNRSFRAGGAFINPTTGDYLFPTINFPGPGQLNQSGSGLTGLAPVMEQFYGQDGTTKNKTTSLYANDAWTVNDHWNFMFGVRFDSMKVIDTDGSQRAKATDFSPRFQARYDLHGDSKHIFTFTAARLGQDFTTGFTDAFIRKSDSVEVRSGWTANTNAPGTGADNGVQFWNYAQLTNPANYGDHYNILSSAASQVAGNLNAPYMDEFTLGYRRSYDNGSFVGLTYVNRTWKNDWAFEQEWEPDYLYHVADPTNSGLNRDILQTHVFNSSGLKRDYNGLEMQWLSILNHVWSWGGNIGYSRLVGNNQGGDTGTGFRDNAPEGYYSFRNNLLGAGLTDSDIAPTGLLINNESERARVYTTAKLPLGKGSVSYSLLFRYDSGGAWSTSASAPMVPLAALPTGGAASPVRPISYTEYYNGRGQYSFNDTYRFDFKVSYAVPIGVSRVQLFGDMQVNNLFNKMIQSTYDTTTLPAWQIYGLTPQYFTQSTFGSSGANDSSRGNAFLGGRTVQFSIGLKF